MSPSVDKIILTPQHLVFLRRFNEIAEREGVNWIMICGTWFSGKDTLVAGVEGKDYRGRYLPDQIVEGLVQSFFREKMDAIKNIVYLCTDKVFASARSLKNFAEGFAKMIIFILLSQVILFQFDDMIIRDFQLLVENKTVQKIEDIKNYRRFCPSEKGSWKIRYRDLQKMFSNVRMNNLIRHIMEMEGIELTIYSKSFEKTFIKKCLDKRYKRSHVDVITRKEEGIRVFLKDAWQEFLDYFYDSLHEYLKGKIRDFKIRILAEGGCLNTPLICLFCNLPCENSCLLSIPSIRESGYKISKIIDKCRETSRSINEEFSRNCIFDGAEIFFLRFLHESYLDDELNVIAKKLKEKRESLTNPVKGRSKYCLKGAVHFPLSLHSTSHRKNLLANSIGVSSGSRIIYEYCKFFTGICTRPKRKKHRK